MIFYHHLPPYYCFNSNWPLLSTSRVPHICFVIVVQPTILHINVFFHKTTNHQVTQVYICSKSLISLIIVWSNAFIKYLCPSPISTLYTITFDTCSPSIYLCNFSNTLCSLHMKISFVMCLSI